MATLLVGTIPVSGCTADAAKRAAYEANYQKGCLDREKTQNCDPEHKSYDEYKKSREKLVKPE